MQPIATLHRVIHGCPGRFHIGANQINSNTLLADAHHLASWGIGSLALWSCHAGADPDFIALLQELTGSRVWSSGHALDMGPAGSTYDLASSTEWWSTTRVVDE